MENTNLGIGARVKHPKFDEGVVCGLGVTTYKIFFRNHGDKDIAKTYEFLEVLDPGGEVENTLSIEDVEEALANVLRRFGDIQEIIPLGDKWKGGTLTLQPHDPELKPKIIPVEIFFHKIVMVRDRLRVLEQSINSHSKLSDEEKVHMEQYITRIYGSLTTFNVLFKNKHDSFTGDSGKDD